MNERDQFAKAVLPALIAGAASIRDHGWAVKHAVAFAELAYVFADAMLEVRNRGETAPRGNIGIASLQEWEE